MIVVVEHNNKNELSYTVSLKSNGKTVSSRNIHYQTAKAEKNGKEYLMIYDSDMNPRSDAFDFLNFGIADQSINSRRASQTALKFLFSFEDIINKTVDEFTVDDVNNLKRFLSGIFVTNSDYEFDGGTVRSEETVNQYLSCYREFLRHRGIEEGPLFQRASHYKAIFNPETGQRIRYGAYKSSSKTGSVQEVPMYISVEEFTKIISVIREKYTVRDEIIVRLEFEYGLRIGEVLGLTADDVKVEDYVDTTTGEIQHVTVAVIRNRVSDKPYQSAKGRMRPYSKKEYSLKKYRTKNYGYQTVVLSNELYDLINEYIEEVHTKLREKQTKNYYSHAIADRVPGDDGDDDNYYIFLNHLGRPLSQTLWHNRLREVFEDCGLPLDKDVKEHNLNHRFRHGCGFFNVEILHRNRLELKLILRHKSIASVECYYRPTISDQIEKNNKYVEALYEQIPTLKKDSNERLHITKKYI